jgi:hypothetical protein
VPCLLGVLGSLIYYHRNDFPRNFLIFNIIISFVFIVSTATRGWTLGFLACMIVFLLFSQKSYILIIKSFISLSFVSILTSFLFPTITTQLYFSGERLMTVEKIAEGDISAGNTLNRLTDYAPVMIENIKKRPILGYGFMDKFSEVSNDHLGYHENLLQNGIIGFLIVYLFIISLIIKLFLKFNSNTKFYSSLLGIISIFVFVLMINNSGCIINLQNLPYRQFLLSLLFTLSSAFYYRIDVHEKVSG